MRAEASKVRKDRRLFCRDSNCFRRTEEISLYRDLDDLVFADYHGTRLSGRKKKAFWEDILKFSSYYFLSCFASCPHPNENILDIEGHLADNLPNAIHQWAIYLIVFPLFARLVFDPSYVFDRAHLIESGVGLIYIGMGFILRITIGKYGIRKVKCVFTSVGVMLFALRILTARVLE